MRVEEDTQVDLIALQSVSFQLCSLKSMRVDIPKYQLHYIVLPVINSNKYQRKPNLGWKYTHGSIEGANKYEAINN